MAEFLIYIKGHNRKDGDTGHWMDDAGVFDSLKNRINGDITKTFAKKTEALTKLQRKYDAKSQYGDIVEVRPDGYWGEPDEKDKHGWDHAVYALVKVPKMKPVQSYRNSLDQITGSGDEMVVTTLKKYCYNLTIDLKAGEVKEITEDEFNKVLVDKK